MTEFISIIILIIGSISDLKTKTIPYWLPLVGVIIGMVHVFFAEEKAKYLLGGIFGLVVFLLSMVIKDLGAGDGLILIVIGLLRGISICLEGFLIALFLLLISGGIIIIVRKYRKKLILPFIPYYLVGIFVVEMASL